ncbi:MAG TPA: IMP dehydrogenase [bacterium]|nr:IMP dehydrogenase [bacterium]
MLNEHLETGLTFDDVLLVPARSEVLPSDANLATRLTQHIQLNIPLVSAAMDTVTEYRTAICLAQEGGIGIIHKNMSIEQQAREVDLVKRSESGMITNPITISPDAPVHDAQKLMERFRISGVPVTQGRELVGILTNRDLRFESDFDQPVRNLMTQGRDRLITVQPGISLEDSKALLHRHRIEKLLVVNDKYELMGLITVKDIEKARKYPSAAKDAHGRLRVGGAVGPGPDSLQRAEALLKAGCDVVVVDTAHGFSTKVVKAIQALREEFPDAELVGGNIVTGEAAEALIKAGVNAVKVGIGPGSICTTRVVAGVGVPQLTAIQSVTEVTVKHDVPVISDGGVKFSGDIVKALAAGADTVMLGNLFAGTDESPGQVILYQGRRYKIYRGMGSIGAMRQGSADRYFQESAVAEMKSVPEGIEGRVPYRGPMAESIYQYIGGLRSGMGYLGTPTIAALRTEARFLRISNAGLRESHVHDVQITEEALNYPVGYTP